MDKLNPFIDGVSITALRIISDERGAVLHMLRVDEPQFEGFGELYFSSVKPSVVKAWKRHHSMVQRFTVPVGAIRLVIYDDRPESPTQGVLQVVETGMAFGRYELIRLPAMVWYGFIGISETESLIANCASLPHCAAEVDRMTADSMAIPYKWTNP